MALRRTETKTFEVLNSRFRAGDRVSWGMGGRTGVVVRTQYEGGGKLPATTLTVERRETWGEAIARILRWPWL